MPYLTDDDGGIKKYPLLNQAQPFVCAKCGCDTFCRDMFSPYWTRPDREGHFTEHIVAECARCGRKFRWTFAAEVNHHTSDQQEMIDDLDQRPRPF